MIDQSDPVRALADHLTAESGGDARPAPLVLASMYLIARRGMSAGFDRMPPVPERR